ncbi:DUF805 domain-containing protein [Pseudomonas sp.]|uniref:DUF805 domain-containing protein n=1 Tax=Pseudomonas sp. TaxID=306 RepID=UPI003D0A8CE1
MTQPRFKVVFNGELMPDVELETAKDNLARLFKSDRTRINTLFSGNPIAIKRDLQENEADQYLIALQRAGAVARKEPDLAASMSLVEIAETPAPVSTEPMTCPKCGHQQNKAPACEACGIIIEKFLARQAQLASAAPEKSPDAKTEPASTPYAPPQANVAETLPEFGDLKVFSVNGRIGRLRYLAWLLVATVVTFGLLALTGIVIEISPEMGALLSLGVVIGMVVVMVMISAQRLHDIGWSAWLLLLYLIPVVANLFWLLTVVMPGTSGANRYGPPQPRNSLSVKILAGLFFALIVLALLGLFLGGFAMLTLMLAGLDMETLNQLAK